MKKVYFTSPNGDTKEIIDINMLKENIIDNFEIYWMQGSGDGYMEFFEDKEQIATLMIGANKEYGIYLHHIDEKNKIDMLSLYDDNKLCEVAETADEIYASIGLFLPLELAWEGIKEFINTGNLSSNITWITPDDIPEEGNW